MQNDTDENPNQSAPEPGFLRRLDAYKVVPEVGAFTDSLRGILAGFRKMATGSNPERGADGVAAVYQVGDLIAALIENLGAASIARHKRGQARPLIIDIHAAAGQSHPHERTLAHFADIRPERYSAAAADVLRERTAQEAKWNQQDHDPETFLAIIAEEVGELAEAILQTRFGGPKGGMKNVRKEAVHATACGLQLLEALDRNLWSWKIPQATLQADKSDLLCALAGVVGVSKQSDLPILAEWLDKQPPSDSELENSRRFATRQAVAALIRLTPPEPQQSGVRVPVSPSSDHKTPEAQ